MPAKLIIRVRPDDRVEVEVKGLAKQDSPKPPGRKLCEKLTRRLEKDLGIVEHRQYADDKFDDQQVAESGMLRLGDD